MSHSPLALVTGASAGIGAVYADRLARRGYDLLVTGRDASRLEAVALELRAAHGVAVQVLVADLVDPDGLREVEARARDEPRLALLVNNAGAAARGGYADDGEAQNALVSLNVVAPARLAAAAVANYLGRGEPGAIINVSSVVAFIPEMMPGAYSATKSFMLTLSQAMRNELGDRGVYVQAVLPGATRTDIWARSGRSADAIPYAMDVEELVDAALAGFDRREGVTIPPLHDEVRWAALEAARGAFAEGVGNKTPAERYRAPGVAGQARSSTAAPAPALPA